MIRYSFPRPTAGRRLGALRHAFFAVALSATLFGCADSVDDYLKSGAAYLDKGETEAALISFKNAVQTAPDSLKVRLAYGEALERSGDLQGAEQQYRRALDLKGEANELTPQIAMLLLDRAEYALLIRDFAKVQMGSASANSDLRALVAMAYLGIGQPKPAQEQLAAAREQTVAVHVARAQQYLVDGQRDKANAEMAVVLAMDKAPWWAYRVASRIFQLEGQAPEALAAMEKAYRQAPLHRGLIGEYAEQLIAAGRKDEARGLRDKLVKIAPRYYRTQYLVALYALEDGRPDEAYAGVTRVLATLPAHVPSQIIAAKVELDRREFASAEARVKKVLRADPNSVEGYRIKVALDLQEGRLVDAAKAIDKALSLAPDDRNLLAMGAEISIRRGHFPKAVEQLTQVAAKAPPRPELYARLAVAQQLAGSRADAEKSLQRAISLAKSRQDWEAAFAAALRMQRFDLAKGIAQEAINQDPKSPEPVMWLAAVVGATGDDAAAIAQTQRALDLRADYYPALVALAKFAPTADGRQQYENRLKKAAESGTKDARIYLDRARILRDSSASPEQIAEVLDRGLAASSGDIELRRAAIDQALRSGRKDQAIKLARDGEGAAPDNPAMQALAASVHAQLGETAQALSKYAQVTERYPERVDWNVQYASLLIQDKKFAEASKILRRLIQNRPDELLPYQLLVRLQLEDGKQNDALVTAGMLRDRPGLKAQGFLLLGDAYAHGDRKSEALKAYSEAERAGYGDAAYERRIAYLDRAGYQVMASSELAKWLNASPKGIAANSVAARRASAQGDYKKAAQHLQVVVSGDKTNPVALNDYAWALAMAGDPSALEWANKALALAPNETNILDTLAQAQRNAGQLSEAKATLRKALSANEDNSVVRLHLAEVTFESGNRQEAKELLAKVDPEKLDKEAATRFKKLNGSL